MDNVHDICTTYSMLKAILVVIQEELSWDEKGKNRRGENHDLLFRNRTRKRIVDLRSAREEMYSLSR